jgi:broad specificity phosphatase PhoE
MCAGVLILVRHAQPQVDPATPAPQWPLSAEGRRAAAAVAERIAPFAPRAAISSPEPKALETARILAAPLGLSVVADPGLAEHRRPDLPFGSRETFEARMAAFFAQPATPFFGGESADAAHARFVTALARHAARPLLVASHGTMITLYLSRLQGLEPFALWKSLALPEVFILDGVGRILERLS